MSMELRGLLRCMNGPYAVLVSVVGIVILTVPGRSKSSALKNGEQDAGVRDPGTSLKLEGQDPSPPGCLARPALDDSGVPAGHL